MLHSLDDTELDRASVNVIAATTVIVEYVCKAAPSPLA